MQHLIDHNEHSVALTTLAWIVVERGRTLTRDQYAELIELVNGFPTLQICLQIYRAMYTDSAVRPNSGLQGTQTSGVAACLRP